MYFMYLCELYIFIIMLNCSYILLTRNTDNKKDFFPALCISHYNQFLPYIRVNLHCSFSIIIFFKDHLLTFRTSKDAVLLSLLVVKHFDPEGLLQ